MLNYKQYMDSAEWRAIRKNILIRDKFHCRGCKRAGSKEVKLTVHHKMGFRPGVPDAPRFLITLCRDCHEAHHAKQINRSRQHFKKIKGRYFTFGQKRHMMPKTVTKVPIIKL